MFNQVFIFCLCCLAVFRAAESIAVDNGPFHVFKRLRESCRGHPVLCEFVTCFYCLSGWFAFVAAIIFFDGVAFTALMWFAIWGGAAVVYRSVRER